MGVHRLVLFLGATALVTGCGLSSTPTRALSGAAGDAVATAQRDALGLGDMAIEDNVTNAKIVNDAITSAKIATGAVTNAKIGALAVDTAQIATAAVTNAKIATDAVGTTQIAAAAVTNAKIATDAVGTTQIANAAVTVAKLATPHLKLSRLTTPPVTCNTATPENTANEGTIALNSLLQLCVCATTNAPGGIVGWYLAADGGTPCGGGF